MSELWTLSRGDAPLIVNVPHCGTMVPEEILVAFTEEARTLPDTDWHVEALYDFVPETGATLMAATHSRYVVDLNRDPAGRALYPGADNTELCPTTTFAGGEIYLPGRRPRPEEVASRTDLYWRPYHAALAAEIARVHARHGYCVLLDGHSIIGVAPRFFEGRLPDLNLGTADGASASPHWQERARAALAGQDRFSLVVNGRFKGGYITRHYGRPERGVHALQLEMAWRTYLDEQAPAIFDRARAAPLAGVLRDLAANLCRGGPVQNSL